MPLVAADITYMSRRLFELLAMLMVGDGVLSLINPKRHCLLWRTGPKVWRNLADEFAEHPQMTRGLGVAEVATGIWLASEQKPKLSEILFHR